MNKPKEELHFLRNYFHIEPLKLYLYISCMPTCYILRRKPTKDIINKI